eukprot:TRINITY_DN16100_c0_g1_i2.p1 TRINITY_DN16100_c0_g1~~TRINITY_DN16100_c0_g1_i2.p1  ORF type:complete len:138 (-),score=21.73 TRINITY_DN16100_c0_g1_i2:38-451(-)
MLATLFNVSNSMQNFWVEPEIVCNRINSIYNETHSMIPVNAALARNARSMESEIHSIGLRFCERLNQAYNMIPEEYYTLEEQENGRSQSQEMLKMQQVKSQDNSDDEFNKNGPDPLTKPFDSPKSCLLYTSPSPRDS